MDFKSKFHFWKVYVMMTFGAIFFFGMGYGLMFEFEPKPGDSGTWMVMIGPVCIVFGFYLVYIYVKQLPVIRMDYQGIKLTSMLRKQEFSWSEVESVRYTGKDSFQFILGYQMEALRLTLKDNTIVKLFYENYANGYLIQQYIKSYHEHQQPPVLVTEKPVSADELSGASFSEYKGMPWLSFRGISLWGFIACMLVLVLKDGTAGKGIIPAGLICAFWYAVNSYFCFYIKISENYLVVKNYFVPFLVRRYRISDIQEIAIETYPKWPNCVRVVLHSYRYMIYPCGLVRDKEWKLIMKDFRDKGIQVRNDALV